MRVITGFAKGRKLRTLSGEDVRPTTDRVKEALFSIIQFEIEGRRVLDLFAGSGQLGIEALSRGAASAVFVDSSRDSIEVVRENLNTTQLAQSAQVIQMDSLAFLAGQCGPFDIALLDPPYGAGARAKGSTHGGAPHGAWRRNDLRSPGKGGFARAGGGFLPAAAVFLWADFACALSQRGGGSMRIAVCPGSFDPVTLGHLDIIRRSSKLFDKVIVVVMVNYHKKDSSFTAEERVQLLHRCTGDIENIEIDTYNGLLADYMREKGAVAIVKGLRAVSDYEYEFQQALTNKRLNPEVETIFITTSAENMFLSSSVVKQVCMFGGDISTFVPSEIREDIIDRLKQG